MKMLLICATTDTSITRQVNIDPTALPEVAVISTEGDHGKMYRATPYVQAIELHMGACIEQERTLYNSHEENCGQGVGTSTNTRLLSSGGSCRAWLDMLVLRSVEQVEIMKSHL